MDPALQKYEGRSPSQIPGLEHLRELVGRGPDDQGVCNWPVLVRPGRLSSKTCAISSPTTVTACFRQSINYSTIFGHDLPQSCGWYMQAHKTDLYRPRVSRCAVVTSRGRRPHPPRSRRRYGHTLSTVRRVTVDGGVLKPSSLPAHSPRCRNGRCLSPGPA